MFTRGLEERWRIILIRHELDDPGVVSAAAENDEAA
jgi:hypothetical protein